jgi:energy-coupling factor transport system permease protein
VESVGRVRRARRLRGAGGRRLRGMRAIAIPVLHDALERSLKLAAAMDSRGYGRTGTATRAARWLTSALMLAGLAGLCIGGYGLLDPTSSGALGIGGFAVGTVLSVGGLALGGRRVSRTRYRPDPWRWPEWLVAGSGIGCAVVLCLNLGYDPAALNPAFDPLHWPSLPLLPAAAILVTAVAAFAAPPLPLALPLPLPLPLALPLAQGAAAQRPGAPAPAAAGAGQ